MYNVAPCSPVLRTGMGENDNGFVRRKFEHLFRSVNLASGTMTSGNRTTGNSMKATDGTASAIQVTYNISGGLLGGVQATNSNMYGTHTIGTGGLNMWKQAYGYDLDAAKTTRGWNETLVLGVGGLVAPGDVSVTGFQANSSYTMSSVFTISGLANVATWGTNSPVNLTGTGINVKNIYLAGSNGQVVDLLHISGGSLATPCFPAVRSC